MNSIDLLKNKKLFKVVPELREKVINIVKEMLLDRDEILLAILFGGFIEYEYTRDIDLAIYLARYGDIVDDYGYAEELAGKLVERIGYPVDIVVINHVNDYLFNTIMLKGLPIIIRDHRLYYGLKLLAYDQKTFFRNIVK